jgi:hypothetical protein
MYDLVARCRRFGRQSTWQVPTKASLSRLGPGSAPRIPHPQLPRTAPVLGTLRERRSHQSQLAARKATVPQTISEYLTDRISLLWGE